MVEVILVCALISLLIAQHFFWSSQVQKLVNKLMSRNYAEYQQSQATDLSEKKQQPMETFDPSVHEDLRGILG